MTARILRARHVWAWAVLVMLASAPEVLGCSVCFGDPNSDLAKGAVRGVLFLGVVIGSILISIAGIAVNWSIKARRITALDNETLGQGSGE